MAARDTSSGRDATGPRDVREVYEAHAAFVWSSLQRLGVREPDLEDVLQEVFVVVHQRLQGFEGNSSLTTWLFGICMRVAANHRRRAHFRREEVVADVPERDGEASQRPDARAERSQDLLVLRAVLDAMDLEKRAIFVMFELEELRCPEIAAVLGLPVGTVYSRLHAARQQFASVLAARAAAQARP